MKKLFYFNFRTIWCGSRI